MRSPHLQWKITSHQLGAYAELIMQHSLLPKLPIVIFNCAGVTLATFRNLLY